MIGKTDPTKSGKGGLWPAFTIVWGDDGHIHHNQLYYLWDRMKRILAPAVTLLFVVVLLAPSLVLLEFKMDQARIARELCVQRDLVGEMRSCHGECQLSKRFKALEEESQAGFPTERVQVRYEPVVDFAPAPKPVIAQVTDLVLPDPVLHLSDGFGARVEHVPRG